RIGQFDSRRARRPRRRSNSALFDTIAGLLYTTELRSSVRTAGDVRIGTGPVLSIHGPAWSVSQLLFRPLGACSCSTLQSTACAVGSVFRENAVEGCVTCPA